MMATTAIASVKIFWSVCSQRGGWRVLVVNNDQSSTWSWSDADKLADAIEEAIDRYDLPACRDDFGVDTREGWAIWEPVDDGE